MNIKRRLQEYTQINREVVQIQEKIFNIRSRMYSLKSSSDIGLVPSSGGGNSDKIGDAVAQLSDLENEYFKKLHTLLAEQKELELLISMLEPNERLLIRAKYIECKTWEEVAVIIGYTWRHTHRVHARALEKLENVS